MPTDLDALPAAFRERLRQIIPRSHWDAVERALATPKPTTFRVNTIKASAQVVRDQLMEQGFLVDRVPWYADAFILRRGRLRDLQDTELYRTGAIYVQSLSSMVPPLILDPQPGDTVLDLTAAPGSKTTQLACLMKNEGRIVANDSDRVRCYKLRANVAQQGATSVEVSLRYGESFGQHQPETFHRVLLDAPCSAEGRFQAGNPKSYRFWKPSKVHEMARKQKRLIVSAGATLQSGGVLVYSTCTFAPEENERVIQGVLEQQAGRLTVEPMTLGFSNCMEGLPRWGETMFDPSMKLTRRILPTDTMEGFFVAKLRKR